MKNMELKMIQLTCLQILSELKMKILKTTVNGRFILKERRKSVGEKECKYRCVRIKKYSMRTQRKKDSMRHQNFKSMNEKFRN